MKIFDIQHFSLHDGPGIRSVVFLKGCPLRCRWCHNPESILHEPQVMLREEKCTGCGMCVDVCPNGAHSIREGLHVFDRDACTLSGQCVRFCPSKALEIAGYDITVPRILDILTVQKVFYDSSGGGSHSRAANR